LRDFRAEVPNGGVVERERRCPGLRTPRLGRPAPAPRGLLRSALLRACRALGRAHESPPASAAWVIARRGPTAAQSRRRRPRAATPAITPPITSAPTVAAAAAPTRAVAPPLSSSGPCVSPRATRTAN